VCVCVCVSVCVCVCVRQSLRELRMHLFEALHGRAKVGAWQPIVCQTFIKRQCPSMITVEGH